MKQHLMRLLAILSVSALLAACGGSSSNGGGGTVTPPTTTATGVTASSAFVVTDAATGVTISAPANAYDGSAAKPVISVAKSAVLPTGASLPSGAALGDVYTLTKDYTNGFLQPVDVTVPYNPANTALPVVMYWDTANSKYVAAPIQDINTTNNTVTFSTVHFSTFAVMAANGINTSTTTLTSIDTGFNPAVDSFYHPNYGSYAAPSGSAMGMSNFAVWYYMNKKAGDTTKLLNNTKGLINKWREGDAFNYQDDATARLVIAAAQKASSQVWANRWKLGNYKLDGKFTGLLLLSSMNISKNPQTLIMKAEGTGTNKDLSALAVVAYKFVADATTPNKGQFHVYDPNFPGEDVTLDWSLAGGFGNFSKAGAYSASFNKFAIDGLPSVGESKQFESLLNSADAGTAFSAITITAPTLTNDTYTQALTGATIPDLTVSGTFTGSASVLGYVLNGGTLQVITLNSNAFSFLLKGTDLKTDNTLVIASTGSIRDPWSFTGFKKISIKYTGTSVNAFKNFGFEDSTATPVGWTVVPTYNDASYYSTGLSTYMDRDVSGSPDPASATYNANWGHVSAFRSYSSAYERPKSGMVSKSQQKYTDFFSKGTYNNLTSQYEYLTKTPGVDPVIDYYENATVSSTVPRAPLGIASALGVTYNGSNALRVNNWDNNNHASVASQTATIPATTSPELRFAWAAILEDPAHSNYDQPFVEVTVTDDDANKTLYRKHFFSGDKTYSGWIPMTTSYTPTGALWNIIPWQQVVVDVSSAVGHKVTVRVIASDCSLGGHGGYAYLDDAP